MAASLVLMPDHRGQELLSGWGLAERGSPQIGPIPVQIYIQWCEQGSRVPAANICILESSDITHKYCSVVFSQHYVTTVKDMSVSIGPRWPKGEQKSIYSYIYPEPIYLLNLLILSLMHYVVVLSSTSRSSYINGRGRKREKEWEMGD